jgi:hypothetical protein
MTGPEVELAWLFTRVAEEPMEFSEVVEANGVGPESWLARGALETLMVAVARRRPPRVL